MKRSGQSLVEYVLIAGLIAIVSLVSLQGLQTALFKAFEALKAVVSDSTASRYGTAGSSQHGSNSSGASAWNEPSLPFSASSPQTLAQANQQLNALFDTLLQGGASSQQTEQAALYFGELSGSNLALTTQLETLAGTLSASNPSASQAILALATQGKLLAANQASIATESTWESLSENNTNGMTRETYWDVLQGNVELKNAFLQSETLQKTIAQETGQQVGNFMPSGEIVYGDQDLSKNSAVSVQLAQQAATRFTQQYEAIQNQLVHLNLTPTEQNIINAASQEIIYKSDQYSMHNASLTYYNSKAIEATSF